MTNQNQPAPAHQTASVQEPLTGYAFNPDTDEIFDLEDGQVIAVLSDGAIQEQGFALAAAYNLADSDRDEPSPDSPGA